jgi:hypothetical protein
MHAPHQEAGIRWRQEVVRSALPGVSAIAYNILGTPDHETSSERRVRRNKNQHRRRHGQSLLQRAEWMFIESNALSLFDALEERRAADPWDPLSSTPTASPMGDTTDQLGADIANALMPHGAVRCKPPTVSSVLGCVIYLSRNQDGIYLRRATDQGDADRTGLDSGRRPGPGGGYRPVPYATDTRGARRRHACVLLCRPCVASRDD